MPPIRALTATRREDWERLNPVTPIVVERFLNELEADGAGRGNQVNRFRILKAVLRDAYGKEAIADDPVKGVQKPEYARGKAVIPSLDHVKTALTAADHILALEIVMMVGCGLRNGEARAVNVNNVVADDVYRVQSRSTPTRTADEAASFPARSSRTSCCPR
jgi:hypothetical protein